MTSGSTYRTRVGAILIVAFCLGGVIAPVVHDALHPHTAPVSTDGQHENVAQSVATPCVLCAVHLAAVATLDLPLDRQLASLDFEPAVAHSLAHPASVAVASRAPPAVA